ncbi:dr1-associated corepressor isoform X5 [Rhineura floridana]|uniref:dr1-associated corepressor isoform X5 n=1 Tax=Rhineura floridana TaxID=261503 RepID=UPI002AC86430|nr:dr1-associated corepressor isoform X5 [Rhineura floridana]
MGRAVSGRSRGGGRRVIHSCLRSGSRAALGPARRAAAEAARLGRARRLLPRVNLIRLFARCRPGRRRRRRKKKMPSKKKKYNARFPPARIKKIMQTDEEIGKVAAAVPVIISRALELFLESLLKKACHVTQTRNAKTMTTSHLGRKPGAGRKNGGTGKGRDPKQSGTDSEEEDDSEDTESNGDEEVSQIVPPAQPAIHLSTAPAPYLHFTSLPVSTIPLPVAAPTGVVPVAPPPAPLAPVQEDEEEEEDYDS